MPASRTDRLPPLPDWAQVTAARTAHIRRVALLLDQWARALGVTAGEQARWLRAAVLHDALKDAPDAIVAALARPRLGPPAIWHGPAAARRAEQDGERDAGVLDAVRYHSVGYAGWDEVGRMLYLADYLDPGRRFDAEPRRAWAARVPADPAGVLRDVARARIERGLRKDWPLLPETVEFWNVLS
jgi:2-amino-4-hydroxy-6-hydroxymethyldihydropteridine diphosphokinase